LERRCEVNLNRATGSSTLIAVGPPLCSERYAALAMLLLLGTFALLVAAPLLPASGRAWRCVMPLDGEWQIADSLEAGPTPSEFRHRVPVPGLANLAQPGFRGWTPSTAASTWPTASGRNWRPRNGSQIIGTAKWSRTGIIFGTGKLFARPRARGRLAQDQQGPVRNRRVAERTKVRRVRGLFFRPAISPGASNPMGRRTRCWSGSGASSGAPGHLPFRLGLRKDQMDAGIYDSVSLIFCDNPVIETVQVAPRISASEIIVQTRIRNRGATPVSTHLSHIVRTWKTGKRVAASAPERCGSTPARNARSPGPFRCPAPGFGRRKIRSCTWRKQARAATPVETRFGLRGVSVRCATRRAYLNGKVYYLAGSNITPTPVF